MCITFFYIAPSPNTNDLKFLVAFNREENIKRPTLALNNFEEDPNIIGGRDMKEKGTWFGFNKKTMNIAFLTNYFLISFKRDSNVKYKSRGGILYNFLKSDFYKNEINKNNILEYLKTIRNEKKLFPPFNLVLGNIKLMKFYYYGNYHEYNENFIIESGLYSMCNFELFYENTNKREEYGLSVLRDLIKKGEKELMENVSNLMMGKIIQQKTRVFQNLPFLTTLTSSILIINGNNEGLFREISYQYKFPLLARIFALNPQGYKITEVELKNK